MLDMSMRGPLSATERALYDARMAEWEALIAIVPQCTLPQGDVGQWRIEKYEITPEDSWHLLRKDMRNGRWDYWTPPGIYTRLTTDRPTDWGWPGGVIMHDQADELRPVAASLEGASGALLECGLGLGLFVTAAFARPAVTALTVVEIDPDIAAVVGSKFSDPRLKIVVGDFRVWSPSKGAGFQRVWIDTIGAHNTPAVAHRYSGFAADIRFYESDPRAARAA